MALSEPVLSAYVGDAKIEVEAASYTALPKNMPHGRTVHGEELRLLVTLAPVGAEYFFVPRDHSDNDPAKFGHRTDNPLRRTPNHTEKEQEHA
jgi:hypothetical protein